jgi:hypothetical protein
MLQKAARKLLLATFFRHQSPPPNNPSFIASTSRIWETQATLIPSITNVTKHPPSSLLHHITHHTLDQRPASYRPTSSVVPVAAANRACRRRTG